MTIPEFLEAFKDAVRDETKGGWVFLRPGGPIRWISSPFPPFLCQCPVVFVAERREKDVNPPFLQAVGALSLSESDGWTIADSADSFEPLYRNHNPKLRRSLVECVGLTE